MMQCDEKLSLISDSFLFLERNGKDFQVRLLYCDAIMIFRLYYDTRLGSGLCQSAATICDCMEGAGLLEPSEDL